jgi:hypothetical protein
MNTTRTLALTAGAAAALAAAGILAAPALASGPPQVDAGNSNCYQTQNVDTSRDGRDHFTCTNDVTGGTGTLHAAYYVNGTLTKTASAPASPSSYTYFELNGSCEYDQPLTILARFTDSTGAQDSATYTVTCEDGY